ncbi:ferredoxin [Streptomyces bambusae]|uniref:ferredoxin n=1 Tax=Streptomyces bambusae TaxID=1550616 RepID=UPI001CFE4366|nr:ferredoxin [Streptomyces bambusae]MCB5165379.1 ferredoxin [Streptomyces bambusae]
MRVEVDRDRCIGAGQCALTAPTLFTQDDDGLSEPLPRASHPPRHPLLHEAARACPVTAITVHEP